MKTYNDKDMTEVENPDLEKGFVYPSRRKISTKRVTLPKTKALFPPNGLQRVVDVWEDCMIYHEFSEQELAAKSAKTTDEKISDAVTAAVALAQGGAV